MFDRAISALIDEKKLAGARRDFENEPETPLNRAVYETLATVDTKATAVLTHVSVMLAAAGVLYSQTTGFLRYMFGAELVAYVVMTLCCLRLIMIPYLDEEPTSNEAVRREAILDGTARFTFFISVIFAVTFVAELIFGPKP